MGVDFVDEFVDEVVEDVETGASEAGYPSSRARDFTVESRLRKDVSLVQDS